MTIYVANKLLTKLCCRTGCLLSPFSKCLTTTTVGLSVLRNTTRFSSHFESNKKLGDLILLTSFIVIFRCAGISSIYFVLSVSRSLGRSASLRHTSLFIVIFLYQAQIFFARQTMFLDQANKVSLSGKQYFLSGKECFFLLSGKQCF